MDYTADKSLHRHVQYVNKLPCLSQVTVNYATNNSDKDQPHFALQVSVLAGLVLARVQPPSHLSQILSPFTE